jgi:hypothetical protein
MGYAPSTDRATTGLVTKVLILERIRSYLRWPSISPGYAEYAARCRRRIDDGQAKDGKRPVRFGRNVEDKVGLPSTVAVGIAHDRLVQNSSGLKHCSVPVGSETIIRRISDPALLKLNRSSITRYVRRDGPVFHTVPLYELWDIAPTNCSRGGFPPIGNVISGNE